MLDYLSNFMEELAQGKMNPVSYTYLSLYRAQIFRSNVLQQGLQIELRPGWEVYFK